MISTSTTAASNHARWWGGTFANPWASLFCIGLAHLPFWLVQAHLFELRPIFSYDLLALLLIGAVLRRPLLPLLLLCWALDIFQSTATSFHFANAGEFAGTLRFARLLHLADFVSADVVGLVALFAACGILLRWSLLRVRTSPTVLLFVLLMAGGLDFLNGSTRIPGMSRDSVVVSANIAGSPLWNMYNRLKAGREVAAMPPQPLRPTPASYAAIMEWTDSHRDASVMLVVVESMGLPFSAELQAAIIEPMRATLEGGAWDMEATSETFSGGTTSGELRVLCGLAGRYQSFRDDEADASRCIPVQQALRGGTAIGLHGFSGQMFDRFEWWPRIGLKQRLFAEDLVKSGNQCGEAFQGLCDISLIQEAVQRLQPERSFVYALTLNTHLPLRDRTIDPAFEQRCIRLGVPHLPCLLMAKQSLLMGSIGRTVRTSSKRPLIVIVGDHAPPFGDVTDRAVFNPHRVPVYIFRPKS